MRAHRGGQGRISWCGRQVHPRHRGMQGQHDVMGATTGQFCALRRGMENVEGEALCQEVPPFVPMRMGGMVFPPPHEGPFTRFPNSPPLRQRSTVPLGLATGTTPLPPATTSMVDAPSTPMPASLACAALTSTMPHTTYIGRPPTGTAAAPSPSLHPLKPHHDLRGRRTLRTSTGHPLRSWQCDVLEVYSNE
ncbi:hypothetical protein GUJ93_ZPchr0006g45159 [Zizania palustris]|uniref:Uncharacterized protein n=1 Tax=Zizania palustris TaxID=103762 RepID=A0A8J5SXA9_ZIZPA|nr:hypothetical protein GUJ93_ZPchr0006g45159 [Zizania palustris]